MRVTAYGVKVRLRVTMVKHDRLRAKQGQQAVMDKMKGL